jgi:hypothetical protein
MDKAVQFAPVGKRVYYERRWSRYRHRAVSLSSGGTLKIIAALEHPPVIAKILSHLGLPARATRHADAIPTIPVKLNLIAPIQAHPLSL